MGKSIIQKMFGIFDDSKSLISKEVYELLEYNNELIEKTEYAIANNEKYFDVTDNQGKIHRFFSYR